MSSDFVWAEAPGTGGEGPLGLTPAGEVTHPVCILMEEHERIEQTLDELHRIALEAALSGAVRTGPLKEVARLLLGAASHHRREEKVVFLRLPALADVTGSLEREHEEFEARKKELAGLAEAPGQVLSGPAAKGLRQAADRLIGALREHIRIEEEIVYQAAVTGLSPAEWLHMAGEFTSTGYCYFTARSAFMGCARCMLTCPTRVLLPGPWPPLSLG